MNLTKYVILRRTRGREMKPELGFRTAHKRGWRAGALYAKRRYLKVHGVYPSNPYPTTDARCEVFNTAYEEGVNDQIHAEMMETE